MIESYLHVTFDSERNLRILEIYGLPSKVAIVEFKNNHHEALKQALSLIGAINDLNSSKRSVTLKVGVYHPRSPQHTNIEFVDTIINSLDKAPKVFLAESDNYCGKGLDRLQIYKELFTQRVVPFNLSEDQDARGVMLAGREMKPEKNPVIQEFVRRGLGEGSLENIEIVGASFEDIEKKFKGAVKSLEKIWHEQGGAPKSWSPGIDSLIREGFFESPNKRTREEVAKALKAKGLRVKGNNGVIATTLTQRVKKGKLEANKSADGWVYWTE